MNEIDAEIQREADELSLKARTICIDNDLVKFSDNGEKVEITILGEAVCMALLLLLDGSKVVHLLAARGVFQNDPGHPPEAPGA